MAGTRCVVIACILGLVSSASAGDLLRARAHAEDAPPAKATERAPSATRELRLDPESAKKTVASVPSLASFSKDFALQLDAEADAALRRGGRHRGHIDPWVAMPSSFIWKPAPEVEFWVVVGHGAGHALMVVLRALANGRDVQHVASLVIDEPDSSLVVGAADAYPNQLVWSTCLGCPGEGGTVRFGDDGKVEITYR